jgi:DNA polymerase-3 subunit gamma/tau
VSGTDTDTPSAESVGLPSPVSLPSHARDRPILSTFSCPPSAFWKTIWIWVGGTDTVSPSAGLVDRTMLLPPAACANDPNPRTGRSRRKRSAGRRRMFLLQTVLKPQYLSASTRVRAPYCYGHFVATQSLYRRYRPRRFSELRGQEHVVKALRNAVINQREGQAYLFSGPRGTGKTSTARILAKVLNCQKPVDGEPCCECDSCVSVDTGTSYDVLELDAASNNGVAEIRDVIESAALSSPGRHRVFILDEVHMLSRGAEAALLKTLEEPPEHVVFVLATTDPQKVSETIRSRVQHLQFHLLSVADLDEYVRWVISDAGLEVSDEVIERVLTQGAGSARDTLSALELAVAGGGTLDEPVSIDEVLEALIARDQARGIAAIAYAVQQGRDPRTLADDIVRTLRDCFLSLMAPELVQLPQQRAEIIAEHGKNLGAARVVRAMEVIGQTLVEMRHAPDARLLLEVSIVRLSSPSFDDSNDSILVRLQQLETEVRELRNRPTVTLPPAPVDPNTGRAKVGGRVAAGSATTSSPRPAPQTASADESSAPTTSNDSTQTVAPTTPAGSPTAAKSPAEVWPQVVAGLKPFAKALFNAASIASVSDNVITLTLPNESHMKRCSEHVPALQQALATACGRTYQLELTADATASKGIERPTDRPKKKKVVEEVAEDPHKPIDPAELIEGPAGVDPSIERLRDAFPGARVVTNDKN